MFAYRGLRPCVFRHLSQVEVDNALEARLTLVHVTALVRSCTQGLDMSCYFMGSERVAVLAVLKARSALVLWLLNRRRYVWGKERANGEVEFN